MTQPTAPPPRHLHIFAISMGAIVLLLLVFLFAVSLEAKITARGVITAADITEIRTRRQGLIEPGWYDDDAKRNGFHPLRAGDELKAGQTLALLYPLDAAPKSEDEISRSVEAVARHAPTSFPLWLVLHVPVSVGEAVPSGTLIARLVPIDPETKDVVGLQVRLELDEKDAGELQMGQKVRLFSSMYPHRLHGTAEAVVERLEPAGEEDEDGTRRFIAWANVVSRPFPLRIGSSVKAEIVIGQKPTYRIILEH